MKKIIFILALTALSGCGVWQNFTTYFNTYYNASKAFEEAQSQLQKNQKELFQFKPNKLSSSEKKQFGLVVKKCSKILQFYSKSSYVPDVLFMLGRTFYYMQEFSKAARKFKELGTLNNDKYVLKNLLWVGKTELQLRNFDSGLAILDSVKRKAESQKDEELLADTYIAQISYFLYNENYNAAVNLVNSMLVKSDNDELNAEATYELGKIYLKLDSLENAANAFMAVDNYSPNFETDFNSKLEYATIKRKLGKIDESLSILEDMQSKNKYNKKRDKIELQIANIFRDRGNINEAINKYMEIDSTYNRTESAGYASYNIAKILADSLNLYDSAMVFYRKTLSSSLPNDFKQQARRKTKVLSKYLALSKKQSNFEHQLNYVLYPETFVQDSLDYEFYIGNDTSTVSKNKKLNDSTKVNSIEPVNNIRDNKNKRTNFLPGFQKQVKIKRPVRPKVSADSIQHSLSKIRYELGNMFLGDLDVPDSAYYYYNLILTNDPNGPLTAKTLFALGSFYSSVNDSVSADSLFKQVYDNYKSDPIAIEAAKRLGHKETIAAASDSTEQMYVDAENLYMKGNYNKAIPKFYNIANNYPKSPRAPKSLYAIGWLLENKLNMPDSAFAVFSTLRKKYRRSEYTLAIIPQINNYKIEQKKELKAISDSIKKVRQDSLALFKKNSLKNGVVVDSLKSNKKNKKLLPKEEKAVKKEKTITKDNRGKNKIDSLKLKHILKNESEFNIKKHKVEKDTSLNKELL